VVEAVGLWIVRSELAREAMEGRREEEERTWRISRLSSSITLGFKPPEMTLYRHSRRRTVLNGASWLMSSRIEFS
jgi:tryptophanyl-tRNA synthetase